jgi:hypothetical protein
LGNSSHWTACNLDGQGEQRRQQSTYSTYLETREKKGGLRGRRPRSAGGWGGSRPTGGTAAQRLRRPATDGSNRGTGHSLSEAVAAVGRGHLALRMCQSAEAHEIWSPLPMDSEPSVTAHREPLCLRREYSKSIDDSALFLLKMENRPAHLC